MDFGLLYELAVPKPWTERSEYDAFWNAIAQIREAEAVGFTHVWAVEHHFREEFSHSGAPEVWLAALAEHTSRIRIGHGVVLLPEPFNNPIRVAERIGTLDIISNGRVEFGTGQSVAELELAGFGIDPGDSRPMWEESLEFLRKVWTSGEEEIEFDGTYMKMPPRRIFPRPLQKPHPPMWMAATSPPSYKLAGEQGLGVLAFGQGMDAEQMGRRLAEWREAMRTSTGEHPVKNENAAVFMMGFCAPTDKQARALCEDSFVKYLDSTIDVFIRWGEHRELPPGYEWYAKAAKAAGSLSGKAKFDYLMDNRMVCVGSPDTLCEVISGFDRVGATQMLLAMQLGSIAHQDVVDSIRLFGNEVMPNFTAQNTVAV